MKKFIFSVFSFVICLSALAQEYDEVQVDSTGDVSALNQHYQNLFSNLNTTEITSGILLDKVFNLSAMHRYNGIDDTLNTFKNWKTIYFELYRSAVTAGNLPAPVINDSLAVNYYENNLVVPIGVIDMEYNRLLPEAIDLNLITLNENNYYTDVPGRPQSPYLLDTVHAVCGLVNSVADLAVNFVIPSGFYFSNLEDSLLYFEIDFNDGAGYRIVQLQEQVNVSYALEGQKEIKVKSVYAGRTLNSRFLFHVQGPDSRSLSGYDEVWPITATIPYTFNSPQEAYYGQGTAYVIFGCGNTSGQIRKPLILVEGFDAKNDHGFDYLVGKLNIDHNIDHNLNVSINNSQFLDKMQAEGYDFILLDFQDGTTYIQRNAYVLIQLIQMVNAVKTGNHELVIIGASMGGLVTRYALAYMETNEATTGAHQTRIMGSFDSPQNGANIPIGDQFCVNFLFNNLGFLSQFLPLAKLLDIATAYNTVNTPAAKQMLLTHYSNFGPHPWRGAFLSELAGLGQNGYPVKLKKVAIVNGNGEGVGQNYGPGAIMVDFNTFVLSNLFLGQLKFQTWAIGTATLSSKFKGLMHIGHITSPLIAAENIKISGGRPLDTAPGGTTDINFLLDEDTDQPLHCFIPSISALDVATSDVFFNIDDNIPKENSSASGLTPFDAYYIVNELTPIPNQFLTTYPFNQLHVDVNVHNTKWAREVAIEPYHFLLQNRNIYTSVDLEARNTITAGRAVNTLYPFGDFVIKSGSAVTLRAGEEIVLKDGFVAEAGSSGHFYIQDYDCSPRALATGSNGNGETGISAGFVKTVPEAPLPEAAVTTGYSCQVYPNPNTGQFLLKYYSSEPAQAVLEIMDLMGKIIYRDTGVIPGGTTSIDITGQPKGMYILKLKSGTHTEVRKIICR